MKWQRILGWQPVRWRTKTSWSAHQNQLGGAPKPVRDGTPKNSLGGQAVISGYHWLQENSALLTQPCGVAHTQLSQSIASGPDTYFLWFSSASMKRLAATQCPPLYSLSASVRSGFLSGAGCQIHQQKVVLHMLAFNTTDWRLALQIHGGATTYTLLL